jgi:hypothetical protein
MTRKDDKSVEFSETITKMRSISRRHCGWSGASTTTHTVNVDCVKFEYVVLAKYHHMLIFEFDLLTKQSILFFCKKLL